MVRVTKSLKIDRALWKEAKIYCIKKGISLCDLMERILKGDLKGKEAS